MHDPSTIHELTLRAARMLGLPIAAVQRIEGPPDRVRLVLTSFADEDPVSPVRVVDLSAADMWAQERFGLRVLAEAGRAPRTLPLRGKEHALGFTDSWSAARSMLVQAAWGNTIRGGGGPRRRRRRPPVPLGIGRPVNAELASQSGKTPRQPLAQRAPAPTPTGIPAPIIIRRDAALPSVGPRGDGAR
ncbi:MAG TPA: hypothetical protein PLD23_10420 [Armatimonadota bacterium]|nr:hypothetical protein [Armatimonadota bacterium]